MTGIEHIIAEAKYCHCDKEVLETEKGPGADNYMYCEVGGLKPYPV
jgi:hypothetical protein